MEMVADLPSGGRFYKLKDPNKPITVRAMKFEDERIIADSIRKKADPINVMIERCVHNIDINQLFMFDKLALLLKIREATYGPKYEFQKECGACGFEAPVSFDLNDLILTEVPDNFTGEEEVALPVLKKKAIIRHPKVSEEKYLTELTSRNLWRFVVSIDGVSKKDVISAVIKKMPLQDVHALIQEIGGKKYGLDPKLNFVCPECGEEEIIELPLGTDFFYKS